MIYTSTNQNNNIFPNGGNDRVLYILLGVVSCGLVILLLKANGVL